MLNVFVFYCSPQTGQTAEPPGVSGGHYVPRPPVPSVASRSRSRLKSHSSGMILSTRRRSETPVEALITFLSFFSLDRVLIPSRTHEGRNRSHAHSTGTRRSRYLSASSVVKAESTCLIELQGGRGRGGTSLTLSCARRD